jgi:hypothetical protein
MIEHEAVSGSEQPKVDTTVSHSARIWNYWLGGRGQLPGRQGDG